MTSQQKPPPVSRGKWPRRIEALGLIQRYGRRYLGVASVGFLATLGVVLARLALPWPLRGVIEVVFPGDETDTFLKSVLWTGADPVLLLCVAYLVLAFASGLFEFVQRVWLTRFVSQTVHDLRAAALEAVQGSTRASNTADLITRVVGDSARLKTNLKGILIHVSQNGLLIVGITVLFLYLAPKLGLLFLLSALLALWLGYLAVDEVTETSLKQREAESLYAQHVYDRALAAPAEAREEDLNRESTRKQVRTERLVSRATLFIHGAVAATISLAMWIGVSDVRSGVLAPGELFLFIAYALTMHRRAVRVGRQAARVGKVLANAQRLGALISEGVPSSNRSLPALLKGIRLQDVRLRSSPSHRRRNRLGPIDLRVAPGAHVAVLGGVGDGKSSLLQVLAGLATPSTGSLLWDDEDLTGTPHRLRSVVSYLPQSPHMERAPVRSSLGLSKGTAPDLEPDSEGSEDLAVLRQLGAARVLHRLRSGLDTVVDGTRLTVDEQRALSLAAIVLGSAPVWVLDTPVASKRRKHLIRLAAVLDRADGRTVIAALCEPCLIDRFSHVVVLRKGKVAFQGPPLEWKAWNNKRRPKRVEV